MVCESSGGYENLLLETLNDSGYNVWQVDPKRVKGFIVAQGMNAKTDAIDAKMLALFSAKVSCGYKKFVPTKEQAFLRNLTMQRENFVEAQKKEKTRLKSPSKEGCADFIMKHIKFLEEQIAFLDKEIATTIKTDNQLKQNVSCMKSIPGIGNITASVLVSHVPELGHLEKNPIAALVGVAPFTRESGIYRGYARIKNGRSVPRRALYMAALTAAHHNQVFSIIYKRLIKKGKSPKVALVAIMRKMIVTANAMLKKEQMWDPKIV